MRQLASLVIQISNVIIYLYSLLIYKVGLCKLNQYKFVLCTNFSLQFEWFYACFSSNFVSSIYLNLGFIFTWYQIKVYLDYSTLLFLLQDQNHSPREHIQSVQGTIAKEMDQSHHIILTPFNYFEWKAHRMEIFTKSKGLFKVTMETKADPNSTAENINWHNKRDEAYGVLCQHF